MSEALMFLFAFFGAVCLGLSLALDRETRKFKAEAMRFLEEAKQRNDEFFGEITKYNKGEGQE